MEKCGLNVIYVRMSDMTYVRMSDLWNWLHIILLNDCFVKFSLFSSFSVEAAWNLKDFISK